MFIIQTIVRESLRTCEIWVEASEKDTYLSDPNYQNTLRKYQEEEFRTCVYVGGERPLLPTISRLLALQ